MKVVYFERDEKMSIMERFLYDHELDEDVMLVKRTGFNADAVALIFMAILAVLVAI